MREALGQVRTVLLQAYEGLIQSLHYWTDENSFHLGDDDPLNLKLERTSQGHKRKRTIILVLHHDVLFKP